MITIKDKEVDKGSIDIVLHFHATYDNDYEGSYVQSATFIDGTPLNEAELDLLESLYPDVLYELASETVQANYELAAEYNRER